MVTAVPLVRFVCNVLVVVPIAYCMYFYPVYYRGVVLLAVFWDSMVNVISLPLFLAAVCVSRAVGSLFGFGSFAGCSGVTLSPCLILSGPTPVGKVVATSPYSLTWRCSVVFYVTGAWSSLSM